MPYIAKAERDTLDQLIDGLSNKIAVGDMGTDDHAEVAGRLNYAVTRLVLNLIGKPRYWKVALYCGVLSNIASEFYRRYAGPYEDKKIAENGDVYPPA